MAKITVSIVALSSCVAVSSVSAVTFDHLKCYKVRDSAPKRSYAADIVGITPEELGCTIKVPGALFCIQTAKMNVAPSPPGGGDGPAAYPYLCYKIKCRRGAPHTLQWSDQFGTRPITPIVSRLVCAPAIPPTTTTSTTTTTTGTTLPFPSCTGGELAPCGTCGNGLCAMRCGASGFVCVDNQGMCDYSAACASDADCAPGKTCVSVVGQSCTLNGCCTPCF
jgi:hypothetical protein